MTEFAQVVVTDDQAAQLAQAIALALENSTEEQIGDVEQNLKSLAVFFATVASEPQRFPITGRMATKIAKLKRQMKGPAQKPSRRNARKQRQLTRQGGAKRRRAERKAMAESFNAAQEAYQAQVEELLEIQREDQARVEALLAQDTLTPAELAQILGLVGAPPQILEAAGKVRASDGNKLVLPPGVES